MRRMRLGCSGCVDGVFPALPGDFAFRIALMRGPEHAGIEKYSRYVVDDELERKMVTRKCQAIIELAKEQEYDSSEHRERYLDTKQKNHKNHPREYGFKFAENRAGSPAHELKQILFPTFPHRGKRPVHADANHSETGRKPDAETGFFHAAGQCDVFQNGSANFRVAADGVVGFTRDQQKLSVCSSGFGGGIVYFVKRKSLRKTQINKGNERFFVPGLQILFRRK